MGEKGMLTTVLATTLAEAVSKDEAPEEGGFDLSAGLFGKNVSDWIRDLVDELVDWQPIETAPWDEEVLLCGPSGYMSPHDKFIVNGYRVRDWHQGQWNDATGTHLSECGWEPLFWKRKPTLPKFPKEKV